MSVNFAEILAPFGLHKEYKRSAPRVIRHLSLVLIVWHNFSEVARHSEEILRGISERNSDSLTDTKNVSFNMLTEHRIT